MGQEEQRASEWAAAEFGGAELGDVRRTRRLVNLAAKIADRRAGTLPGVFEEWAELKATYRLLGHDAVTYEKVLAPHLKRTREACQQPGHYLLIEDSSSLDFSSHRRIKDLGWIGDGGGWGLNLHSNLALRIESWREDGTPQVHPVGLFAQKTWIREYKPGQRQKATKVERLSRDRESQRWGADFAESGGPPDGSKWTYVADRESDVYEVFSRCGDRGVDFIIRANQRRALHEVDGSVFDAVAGASALGVFQFDLRARPGAPARQATLEVRTKRVTLRAPWRPNEKLNPYSVNVVEAREIDTPAEAQPIHWVLFTTWSCADFGSCLAVIRSYSKRWIIEEYFKALKTGVGIEESQLSTRKRIEALLGVFAVAAVRLLRMKLIAARQPDCLVESGAVGEDAIEVLEAKFGKPSAGWTNRGLWVAVARLGGFIARKSDGNPGWLTIWRGWQALMLMIEGIALMRGRIE